MALIASGHLPSKYALTPFANVPLHSAVVSGSNCSQNVPPALIERREGRGFTSYVYNSIGTLEPLTVTRSSRRQSCCTPGEKSSYIASEIRKVTPYCFVAASNRAAMFTFGDRYEASIFIVDPMAPSIAHP